MKQTKRVRQTDRQTDRQTENAKKNEPTSEVGGKMEIRKEGVVSLT